MSRSSLVLVGLCAIVFYAGLIEAKRGEGFKQRYKQLVDKVNETQFAQEILELHNSFRAIYGAPDVVLSETLCQQAKKEAQNRVTEYINTGGFSLINDPDRSYNDNIWAKQSSSTFKLRANTVVQQWFNEKDKHDFKNNNFQEKSGHFSQLIWRSTDEIGVGFALNRTNPPEGQLPKYVYVVVVRYTPPGNILDSDAFEDNVGKPQN